MCNRRLPALYISVKTFLPVGLCPVPCNGMGACWLRREHPLSDYTLLPLRRFVGCPSVLQRQFIHFLNSSSWIQSCARRVRNSICNLRCSLYTSITLSNIMLIVVRYIFQYKITWRQKLLVCCTTGTLHLQQMTVL